MKTLLLFAVSDELQSVTATTSCFPSPVTSPAATAAGRAAPIGSDTYRSNPKSPAATPQTPPPKVAAHNSRRMIPGLLSYRANPSCEEQKKAPATRRLF